MPFAKVFLTVLYATLSYGIIELVRKVLAALGIGFIVYTGADYVISNAYQLILANISALPTSWVSFLAALDIDKMITLIISAYLIRASMRLAGFTVSK